MRKSNGGAVRDSLQNGKSIDRTVFPTEAELVRYILESGTHLARGISRRQPNILKEFDSSAGRADIVLFQLRNKWRTRILYGELPPRWLYALRVLPVRKYFTSVEFAQMTGVSMNTAMQKLRLFEQMGYCKQRGRGGSWSKIRQPLPIVKRIIAFEAKLHDWKRAISQAYRYQRYANQAWVVLDASRAKGATRATEQFRRLNIGLKVLYRTGHSKTLVRPRFRSPKSPYHFWEANSLIAASLSTLK